MDEYPVGMRGTVAALPDVRPELWMRSLTILGPREKRVASNRTRTKSYSIVGYLCDVEGEDRRGVVVQHNHIWPLPPEIDHKARQQEKELTR